MTGNNKPDPKIGHRQRLRDKFNIHGLEKFTDEEIIELLLTFGTPRRDCKKAARDLLEAFGDIRSVFEAEPKKLAEVSGVGPNNITAIQFIHAVSGKYLKQRLVGREYLASSLKVYAYLRHHMEHLEKETFKIIYLDGANGVLALEDGPGGTLQSVAVYPREIIERALTLKAAALVFAHSHPAGKTSPSGDDYKLTRKLVHAAHLVDMKVVDHLIIGKDGQYFSFRDQGRLSHYEREFSRFYQTQG